MLEWSQGAFMKAVIRNDDTESQVDPIFGFFKGKLEIVGDIMSPSFTDEEYEEFFRASETQLTAPSDPHGLSTPPDNEAQR